MTTVVAGSLCPPGPPEPGWVAIDDATIVETGRGPVPAGRDVVDLGDVLLVPGYLDLQVNGVGDADFATAGADGWVRARRRLLAAGTTGFCPTLVTAPLDAYDAALTRAGRVPASERGGADVLGVHLEGPFLGGAPGAHSRELLRTADTSWLVR
ncbi:MAG TPA: hypothetical protein VF152_00605, partial [Acidimicrobiia bacterium]